MEGREGWNGFLFGKSRLKMFPADSVEERTRMGTGSGTVRGTLLCISGKTSVCRTRGTRQE